MRKIYQLILTILLATIGANAQAPAYQWVKGIGVHHTNLEIDSLNNVYVTGQISSGPYDFDPGPGIANLSGNASGSCYIAKYDPNGNYVWAYLIGTSLNQGFGISLSVKGNYVHLLANLTGTVDLNPGPAVNTVSLTSGGAPCIIKFDLAGNFIWGKNFNTSSTVGTDIKVDDSKNVYICGRTYFTNFVSFANKYDANGTVIWQTSFPSTATGNPNLGNIMNSIDVDASQNVYLTGQCNYNTPSLSLPTPSTGSHIKFIAKLNPNGSVAYGKSGIIFNDPNIYWTEIGYSVEELKVDPVSNSLVITGGAWSGSDFDFGPGVQYLSGTGERFVAKYDLSANFLWGFFIDSPAYSYYESDLALDPAGNILFTSGISSSTVVMHPAVGTPTLSRISAYEDIVVAKYTPAGAYAWSFNVGGGNTNTGTSIKSTGSSVFITAYGNGVVDYDVSAATATSVAGGAIAKYADCSSVLSTPGTISGISVSCPGTSLTYSVSPVSGASFYNWSLPGGWTGTSTTTIITTTASTGSGTISVSAGNICGSSALQTLSVTINPTPTITVNSGAICSGDSFTLSPSGASTYSFSSGSPVVSPTSTTTYSVDGTSAAGCISTASALSTITVNPLPTITASSSDSLLCTGQSSTLTAAGASTYTWNPGGAGSNIVVSPATTTSYSVTGTDSNGCLNTSVLTQSVSLCTPVSQLSSPGSNVSVYPNPTTGKVIIAVTGEANSIEIYNSNGQLISFLKADSVKSEIDLSSQSSGIYFIRISADQNSILKKIIKN